MKLHFPSWTQVKSRIRTILNSRYLSWFKFQKASFPVRITVLLLMLGFSGYIYYLDNTIREAFEGRKFSLPARVYGRALEIYPGLNMTRARFVSELKSLGYHESPDPMQVATYHLTMAGIEFTTRDFVFAEGPQRSQHVHMDFADGQVAMMQEISAPGAVKTLPAAAPVTPDAGMVEPASDMAAAEDTDADTPASAVSVSAPVETPPSNELTLLRMEPPLIGGIYPGHNEDRELVRLNQVPKQLVDALIATEDRKFYTHHGIDPRGIARAVYKTVTGQRIEGGSTLTQQLVKNFFLTTERTLTRKANEVMMSLLLEMHYDKGEILETYLNEVFLGQDAGRAIHGFGLASYFYFDKPLDRLEPQEIALLVGLVKGPTYYDPRRHPERALKRRNVVLQEMASENVIPQMQASEAIAKPLGIVDRPPAGTSPYPAFMQYVYRQLQRDYREDDLRSEGLRIFTTLDPFVQHEAEAAITTRLDAIEKKRRIKHGTLEAAVVVSSTQTGEIQAIVGGRDARFAGFNRALDSQRPIGSVIKPVIYLTALEDSSRYTLVTQLDDSPLVYKQRGAPDWKPKNYEHTFHDRIQLRMALAESLNVATARLGIDLGVERVLGKLPEFGVNRPIQPYAASLLGSFGLAPIEVLQMYQTLADGGFRTPLRAIRSIVTADGRTLQRYQLEVQQVAKPGPVFLVTTAMQGVVREGTAVGMKHWLPAEMNVAGKTGTTEDLRDSWFAGFTGDRVAVAWVGRDNNMPTRLTGASGAMTIWAEMMKNVHPEPLQPMMPEDVEMADVDPESGVRYDEGCSTGIMLPFIKGSAPADITSCPGTMAALAPDAASAPAASGPRAVRTTQPASATSGQSAPVQEEKKSWLQRLFD